MKNYVWALLCISFMVCQANPETTLEALQRYVTTGTTSVGGAAVEAVVALALLTSAASADYLGDNGMVCGPLAIAGAWVTFDMLGRCMAAIPTIISADTFPPR